MKREIETVQHQIQPLSIPDNFEAEPTLALEKLAEEHNVRWLLAHADDGIIWGEFRADGLHLSGDAFPQVSPPLRAATLQQARLFGPNAELLLWKESGAWRARLIQDGSGKNVGYYNETYLLWGSEVEQYRDSFALLCQGREGLRHALPLPPDVRLHVRLRVRHYLDYDSDGQAYIAYSRLVGIVYQGGKE